MSVCERVCVSGKYCKFDVERWKIIGQAKVENEKKRKKKKKSTTTYPLLERPDVADEAVDTADDVADADGIAEPKAWLELRWSPSLIAPETGEARATGGGAAAAAGTAPPPPAV
jgi:hypothetical protein